MATKLATIVADFTTSLATAMAVGATTATLQSATDDDGVPLPAGVYFFALDGNNAQKEHIVATLSGTSLTAISSISRQGVQTSGVVRSHRVGSTVTLTDFAHIKYMNDLLSGTTTFNASVPLGYDSTASITTANQLATKAYVDGVAIAGGTDASTTNKGITKMSVAPASATSPIAVGDNDGRVPTQGENDALVGSNTTIAVGSGNKFVTQTGLQNRAETYAASTGSANAYVLTLSPVPTALAAGQEFEFKANFANTGAATLNVNSLGAIAIKKVDGATALAAGDIASGQIVKVKYDGTNFQMLNPIANAPSVSKKQTVVATPVTVTNTVTDTALITTSILANTLGTSNAIRLKMSLTAVLSNSNASAITLKLKYGSSTLASIVLFQGDATTRTYHGYLDAILAANGATNAQVGSIQAALMVGGASPTYAAVMQDHGLGTAAEDSTGALNLVVSVQEGAAAASISLTMNHAVVEIIQ